MISPAAKTVQLRSSGKGLYARRGVRNERTVAGYLTNADCQFNATAIGGAAAPSTAAFMRKRPSGPTSYCAREPTAGGTFVPLASCVENNGTGERGLRACPDGSTSMETDIRRLSGAT